MIIGSLDDQVTWNGESILEDTTSSFELMSDHLVVKATRSENSSLVENLSQRNPGLDVSLPLGVKLIVNRLHHQINIAVKMRAQEDGQDGLCGNFNGVGADDAMDLVSARSSLDVPLEESLFEHSKFH